VSGVGLAAPQARAQQGPTPSHERYSKRDTSVAASRDGLQETYQVNFDGARVDLKHIENFAPDDPMGKAPKLASTCIAVR